MKMVYERPVMKAEVYATNAYCSACGPELTKVLTTSASSARNSINDRNGWDPGRSGFTESDLAHTFDPNGAIGAEIGLCGPFGSSCDNTNETVWQCSCHPDDPWYLEWSHYYSVHDNRGNNGDVFFLYHESNGVPGIQLTPNSSNFPAIENGTDYNVALVVYKEEDLINNIPNS